MLVDDIDAHLPAAGSIEKAAVPLGMFLAWCVNMRLTSAASAETEALVLRLRYREITGSELLIAGYSGRLDRADFNSAGLNFVDKRYSGYLSLFADVFDGVVYEVKDDWPHYDRLAKPLTQLLLGPLPAAQRRRRWWKFWQ